MIRFIFWDYFHRNLLIKRSILMYFLCLFVLKLICIESIGSMQSPLYWTQLKFQNSIGKVCTSMKLPRFPPVKLNCWMHVQNLFFPLLLDTTSNQIYRFRPLIFLFVILLKTIPDCSLCTYQCISESCLENFNDFIILFKKLVLSSGRGEHCVQYYECSRSQRW